MCWNKLIIILFSNVFMNMVSFRCLQSINLVAVKRWNESVWILRDTCRTLITDYKCK